MLKFLSTKIFVYFFTKTALLEVFIIPPPPTATYKIYSFANYHGGKFYETLRISCY